MDMRLMNLKIRNFMGCKELDIEIDGKNMKIYGDNGTGKTTIQHAFNWLLFDKNAYGKTDFGIKPVDAAGNVIHRLETSVEALFDVDGVPKQFKKVLMEKWTRKRGSAEETYSGNENSFYVNTIPKKKKEFNEEIAKMINEDVFRMITNPLYFNENIKWQDRRKMLLDICGNISDEDVIRSEEELLPLLTLLKGRTVEELKSIVSSEMKSINKELGIIPSRIAEAELAKPTPRDDVDVSQLEVLEQEQKDLVQKKSDILNGAEVLRMKATVENMKNDLQKKKGEEFNKYSYDEYKEFVEVERFLEGAMGTSKAIVDTTIPHIDFEIESNKKLKKQLSNEWDEVFKKAFLGSTCPTCKQELPPEQVEEKKKEFNRQKAEKLDVIEERLNIVKKRDNDLIFQRSEAKSTLEELTTQIEEKKKRMSEVLNILTNSQLEFRKEKARALEVLAANINDLENEIIEQELNAEDLAKEVDVEIDEVIRKIAPIKEYMSEQSMIVKQDFRIMELKAQQETLSGRYSELERQLFLTEKFIRCKVAMITEKINTYFKYASFRLFNVQENGGIAETCEATYKGVPYRDLNTAGKINIGLDIINTLSMKYNTIAPIFVDNMESITRPIDTVAQRIELVVSEADKELRFEKGN